MKETICGAHIVVIYLTAPLNCDLISQTLRKNAAFDVRPVECDGTCVKLLCEVRNICIDAELGNRISIVTDFAGLDAERFLDEFPAVELITVDGDNTATQFSRRTVMQREVVQSACELAELLAG